MLWACLLVGWLGVVCSLGVFVLLVLAFGWVRVVRFALAALVLSFAWRLRAACGVVLACAGWGVCRVGRVMGRDNHVPPLQCGCVP